MTFRLRDLGALALAASVLAGCGGGGGTARVVSAAKRTLSQNAASALTLQKPALFGARPQVLARAGSLFDRGLGYEAIDVPDLQGRQGGRVYLVFLPGSAYVRPAVSAAAGLPAGKSWVVVPLTRAVDRAHSRVVEQLEGLNPQLPLDEIVWGAEKVTPKGTDVVDHLPLARYEVSVNLRRAIAAATGPGAGAMRIAMEDELAAGGSPLTLTVWVDGPGRVARVEGPVPGSGLGKVAFDLSGFGSSITPSFPADSDMVGLAGLPGSDRMSPLLAAGIGA